MPSSPTARDAAEGLAEIEGVLAEHKAGRISGSLAASTIGLMFLKHQGPLLAAFRSAGTEGGETRAGLRAALEDLVTAFDVNEATGTVTVKPDRILSPALRNARGALEDRS